MAIVRAWQLAFAAKNAAQHAADDLATDFAADRAGGTADELFAGRGARAAHATAKNGAQAVKQTTAGRCRCRAVIARFGRRPGPAIASWLGVAGGCAGRAGRTGGCVQSCRGAALDFLER